MSLQNTGSVALVGGGPGHPDLITVRGRQLLTAADVVIADRLGPRALLDDLGPDTEVIDVGKQPHHHPHHDPSGGGAYDKSVGSGQEYNEATFFTRHRGKLAAGVMVVVAIIFFTFVVSTVRW